MAEHITSRGELLETARQAEVLGYATFLLRDHFIAEPFGSQLGPLPALTAVAMVTSQLRVGTLVICNDYRHPALLAQEAATLDVLSEGRLELGLGAGFSRAEYEAAGLPFDRAGLRIARLEESLRCLKALFADGAATWRGTHYELRGLDGFPKPVQRPHPPITLAGALPRMLRLAAREADVVNLQTVTLTSGRVEDEGRQRLLEAEADRLRVLRAAAGTRFDAIELSKLVTVSVTDAPEQTAADLIRARGWADVTPAQVLDMPSILLGTPDSMVDRLCARREQLGFSYIVVPRQQMAALAPVVSQLAGR